MSKRGLIFRILFIGLLPASSIFAQVTTIADGPWNDPNTWSSASIPDETSGAITIDHAVTVPSGFSVTTDQTTVTASGVLTIDAGGSLTVANTTTDLIIDGIVVVYGRLINANGAFIDGTDGNNLMFEAGSVFEWGFTTNEGVLPLAIWDPQSTLLITGYTSAKTMTNPNWGQSFGNFTWNCTAQSGNISLAGLVTDIQGSFTILSTGTGTPRVLSLSTVEGINLTIANDFVASGISRFQITTTGSANLTVGGNVNFTSTGGISFAATSGEFNIDLAGDFIMNAPGSRWRNGSAGTSSATWNIGGDFINLAGTFDEGTVDAVVTLNFTSGTTHTFVNDGTNGIISGAVRYNIGPDDILEVGTSFIQGTSGSVTATSEFHLYGTVRLGSLEPTGAIRLATNLGNLRTPTATRFFYPGSTIEYNGLAAQFVGNGHPTSADVNVIINNAAGVTAASGIVTIDGDLTLAQGNLNINSTSAARTLNLGGNISANGNFITFTGALSNLVVYGDGDFGVFPFPAATQTLRDFTLDRTGGSVTFASPVTITRVITLTAGDLIFNNQTLNLSGTFASTGGFLSSNASSTLNITGSGAFGTLVFSESGNTLNTLSFNRTTSGSATLDGTLIVTNSLLLSNGSLTNNAGLILGDGATIVRNSSASLLANRPTSPSGNLYNVTYTGTALTTGLELPDPSETDDNLNHLIINGGPVTLAQNLMVHGNVNLNNSTFNASTFNITMEGPQWNDNAGNFSPGTGTLIFTGVTTVGGSSIPVFSNIQVNSGATLNLPSGNVNVSGNLQFIAGGTVNANGGTVTLNSATLQSIAGAGMTLHNLTLTKGSSADATLTSALNLTGALTITSSNTDFASNGLLTLRSTSDGATGNASVAPLLNGASVSGNVTVQRYMSDEGGMYRYISSPVTNATVAQLQDDFPVTGTFTGTSNGCPGCYNNSSLFVYNVPTNAYVAYPTSANTEILTPGRGYSSYNYQNLGGGPLVLDLTGPINQGTVGLPVVYNAGSAESWNLVGNPFASSIDWDNIGGWTKTNVNTQVAVRDNGAGGVFRYWDGSTGGLTGGVIAAGQAFWVRTIAASPLLTVNENAKTTTTGVFYREEEHVTPDVLIVSIDGAKVWDKAYLRVSKDAADNYDLMDVTKFSNDYFNLASKTLDGKVVAINAVNTLNCGSQILLDLAFTKRNGAFVINPVGDYKLSLEKLGQVTGFDVTLIDQFTSKSQIVNEGDVYNFKITTDARSYSPDRFRVVFSERVPTTLSVSGFSQICEGSASEIKIEGAETSRRYQVLLNDVLIEEVTGSEEHVVVVNASSITGETATLQVNALGSCGTTYPANSMVITKAIKETAVAESYGKICGSGSVELKASGSSTGKYNWYDSEHATAPVAASVSSFVTPSLTKTKQYYVAALNQLGCEGPRTLISAEVVPATIVTVEKDGDALVTNTTGGLQWYLNDELLSGETDIRIKPNVSGFYSVSKVNESCTSNSPKLFFEYINREGLPYGIVVYPNPTKETIKVNYPENTRFKRAALYNPAGMVIADIELRKDGSTINGELNVRNLPAGIYIVKIFGQTDMIAVKVVKD